MRPTIAFESVSNDIVVDKQRRAHLRDVDIVLPARRIALLGDDPADVGGVVDLLCRRSMPVAGRVRFEGAISWPIGRSAAFAGAVKGTDQISHLCMLYDCDRGRALDFMSDVFEEPDLLPVRMDYWPAPLRARFALLAALIPPFDIYLVDGSIVSAQEPEFTRLYLEMLARRVEDRLMIVASRQKRFVDAVCDSALIVRNLSLDYSEDIAAARASLAATADAEISTTQPSLDGIEDRLDI